MVASRGLCAVAFRPFQSERAPRWSASEVDESANSMVRASQHRIALGLIRSRAILTFS